MVLFANITDDHIIVVILASCTPQVLRTVTGSPLHLTELQRDHKITGVSHCLLLVTLFVCQLTRVLESPVFFSSVITDLTPANKQGNEVDFPQVRHFAAGPQSITEILRSVLCPFPPCATLTSSRRCRPRR